MSLTCHMCPAVQIILIWNWLKCLTFLKHPIAETEGSEGHLSHCLGKTPCVQQRMNIWLQDNNKSTPCQRAKAKYCNRFDNKAEPPPFIISSAKNCLFSTQFLDSCISSSPCKSAPNKQSGTEVWTQDMGPWRHNIPAQSWNCTPRKVKPKARYTHSKGASRWWKFLHFTANFMTSQVDWIPRFCVKVFAGLQTKP